MSLTIREMHDIDLDYKDLKKYHDTLNKERDLKFTLTKEDKVVGYILIHIVTTMNEFKLGNMILDFDKEEEAEFLELFRDFLHSQIIDNSMLKITCLVKSENKHILSLLKNSGFIVDDKVKTIDSIEALKITKPIFLERVKK